MNIESSYGCQDVTKKRNSLFQIYKVIMIKNVSESNLVYFSFCTHSYNSQLCALNVIILFLHV
jgi:hypothetical protein